MEKVKERKEGNKNGKGDESIGRGEGGINVACRGGVCRMANRSDLGTTW